MYGKKFSPDDTRFINHSLFALLGISNRISFLKKIGTKLLILAVLNLLRILTKFKKNFNFCAVLDTRSNSIYVLQNFRSRSSTKHYDVLRQYFLLV